MTTQIQLHKDPTFVSDLQHFSKLLVEKLQSDSFQDASEMIETMIQARDKQVFNSVGQLTRGLHNAIVNFNVDGSIDTDDSDSTEIHDATDRLNYVLELTQTAADKTMDMVEASVPIAMNLGEEANSLHDDWMRLRRREMTNEEFSALYSRMDKFLGQMCEGTGELNKNMQAILLEQGFQDLTGQVLKKVITLVRDVEKDLVSLVRVAGQVEEITGMVEPSQNREEGKDVVGEGPQIHANKRNDVVQNQDEVDDLLSSLGF